MTSQENNNPNEDEKINELNDTSDEQVASIPKESISDAKKRAIIDY